jgi:phosphoserine phosphatase RsbU/P
MARPHSHLPSITALVAFIVVTPILVVSAVLAALSWIATARISENLGQAVMTRAAQSTAETVQEYLSDAVAVSDRFNRRLEAGDLPDPPGRDWQRTMLDNLVTSHSVASICYGNVEGDATYLLRAQGHLEVGFVDKASKDGAVEYAINPITGKLSTKSLRVYTYDPRQRPWWDIAVHSDTPTWTPIYPWYGDQNTESLVGTGYVRQIKDPSGKLRGVLLIDVTLGALSHFLRQLEITNDGEAFIVDAQDKLIAASRGRVVNDEGQTYALADSPDVAARDIAAVLAQHSITTENRQDFPLIVKGVRSRLQLIELKPYPGIDWRVIVVLPESSFLAEAERVRFRAVTASAIAVIATFLIGLWLAHRLSRPVVLMTEHVKKVGDGDFETRLNLRAASEFAILSDEINNMATGLKDRMSLEQSLALAMEVQKSLLPACDPSSPLLDIAGRSKYCDQTGGDYYDFIDIAQLSASSLLVAVGDVTGHGIPAALVMATARAALRATALRENRLADLMTQTNQILSQGNTHNRFMTLALLLIDAESRIVRWASGGHDPAIVYHPQTDAFTELRGGDLPLGINPDTEYEEFSSQPLPESAIIAIGTDGVWEMFNEQNEQYGKDRLRDILQKNHTLTAAAIASALESDLAAFRGARIPVDDVTFVIIKLLPITEKLTADARR